MLFFWAFFTFFDRHGEERTGKQREREMGEDMWQRAAGQIRTWARRSQSYGMWSPAQRTLLNRHLIVYCLLPSELGVLHILCASLYLFIQVQHPATAATSALFLRPHVLSGCVVTAVSTQSTPFCCSYNSFVLQMRGKAIMFSFIV